MAVNASRKEFREMLNKAYRKIDDELVMLAEKLGTYGFKGRVSFTLDAEASGPICASAKSMISTKSISYDYKKV